jgi:hypothetical protein
MTDDMNKFWEQLRKQTADPQGFTPLTDAEAERRMAAAGEEPMSEDEIAAIVRKATAEGPQGIVPQGIVHRDIEKPQAQYFMKVAAAVLVTVALVAGVVSTRAMLWPERDDPTQTLQYRDAILIALNGQEEEKARRDSIFKIGTSTRTGIRGLQNVRRSDSALRTLRETLESPAVFEERDLSRLHAIKHAVRDSVEFIQDTSNPLNERVRRQRELEEQLQLGVLALKKVCATEAADGPLGSRARIALEHLRRQLPN